MSSIDLELLRHALTVAKETGLHEVEVMVHGANFQGVIDPKVSKRSKVSPMAFDESIKQEVRVASPIKSNAVGIFRIENNLAPGIKLKKGEKVGSIVALGISNDVLSNFTGIIEEVLIEDNGIVEYGQILARVQES